MPTKSTTRKATKRPPGRPRAARKAAKRTTKRTVKKVAKRTARKAARTVKLSPQHKRALAMGREQGAAVRRYLAALNTTRPRGRQRTPESVEKQILAIEARMEHANPLARLQLIQKRRNLETVRKGLLKKTTTDISKLESAFVKIAAAYGKRKGITYGSWRAMHVPSEVLAKARIKRARG